PRDADRPAGGGPRLHACPRAEVRGDARSLHAMPRADVGGRLVEIGLGARDKLHVAAFRRQRMGDRQADALRRTGDQRASATQIEIHGTPAIYFCNAAPVSLAISPWRTVSLFR